MKVVNAALAHCGGLLRYILSIASRSQARGSMRICILSPKQLFWHLPTCVCPRSDQMKIFSDDAANGAARRYRFGPCMICRPISVIWRSKIPPAGPEMARHAMWRHSISFQSWTYPKIWADGRFHSARARMPHAARSMRCRERAGGRKSYGAGVQVARRKSRTPLWTPL